MATSNLAPSTATSSHHCAGVPHPTFLRRFPPYRSPPAPSPLQLAILFPPTAAYLLLVLPGSRFGIQSFPKFLLFNPRYEWSEEYPKQRLKELGKSKEEMGDDIVEWATAFLPLFEQPEAVRYSTLPS